ncbi:hypothetical protein F8568_026045 [Actinomadura sp. LD22]|uniref:Uncharacterized protein n=1 Tax=Actinomadura physcomitrii TaxID=2650748 RepID=A0A6I4MDK6_9ACTN|nr:hypothetical protein [Actinomadura physcomitrii]MWA03782.1 hypothetical protein [Actinomadura physcomitrii]
MNQPPAGGAPGEDPDVLLDVPVVKVDEVEIEVEELRADVSLRAAVLDVLDLGVGADVDLGRVSLTLRGVEAQAMLKVRLDNVARIIDRVLDTVDANPELLAGTARGAGAAAGELGAGTVAGELGGGAGRVRNGIDARRPPRRPHAGRETGLERPRPAPPPGPGPGPRPRRDEPERRHEPEPQDRRERRDDRERRAARDVPEKADDLAAGALAAALARKSVRAGRDLIGGVLKRLPGM